MNLAVLLRLAREIGPLAVKLILKWAPMLFDKNNKKVLEQVWDLLKKFAAAQKARTKTERLRKTLGVVQDRAREIEHGSASDARKEQAQHWRRQADSLLGALALLEVRKGPQRRADIKRISEKVDVLFSAVMEATMTTDPPADAADHLNGTSRRQEQTQRVGGDRIDRGA